MASSTFWVAITEVGYFAKCKPSKSELSTFFSFNFYGSSRKLTLFFGAGGCRGSSLSNQYNWMKRCTEMLKQQQSISKNAKWVIGQM